MKVLPLNVIFWTLFWVACGYAQNAVLTITSAGLTIDPQSTDSYTLQGTFSGLSFSSAQSVTLSIGQFSGTIPMSSFVQQPGTNALQYQDPTGQTPYWLSSLTIDPVAQTFTATATGIVLAGLSNPFAVQLTTDQTAACSMARVQQASDGSYQLTPGDRVNEPCQIPAMPVLEPILAGSQSNVTVTVTLLPTSFFDYQSFQLFLADPNGQPSGDGLCTLTDNGDGTYSCTAPFNPATPGPIPLLVQGRAFGKTILSPGFCLQVVGTPDDVDMDQMSAIQNTISQTWQYFQQYGDSAYARIQSIAALRALFSPRLGLTGQPVGLAQDGLSISVRADAGLVSLIILNDLQDVMPASGGNLRPARRAAAGVGPSAPRPRVKLAQGNNPPQCGEFTRDIVKNNKVLIWDPGSLFFFPQYDPADKIAANLASAKCPKFDILPIRGAAATAAAMDMFPDYGTVIIMTHGGIDVDGRGYFVTGESGFLPGLIDFVHYTFSYTPTPDGQGVMGPYVGVYGNSPHVHALKNSIIFAAACSAFNPTLYNYFAPAGSKSVYYGFPIVTDVFTLADAGSEVFRNLVYQYSNAVDAWAAGNAIANVQGQDLHMWYDENLAYVGNPKLTSPTSDPPFTVPAGKSLTLQAQLDGAESCDKIMQYHWMNTALNGHLKPASGGSGQDDYSGIDSLSTYTTNFDLSNSTSPSDQIKVDFAPDLSNPNAVAIAAEACTTIQNDYCLSVIGNDMGKGCTFNGSGAGDPWTLTLTTLPQEMGYGTFTITFGHVPKPGGFGVQSDDLLSASATVSPGGKGTSPTYTMSCTPPFDRDPDCGFVLELKDMSDPSMPHGDVVTGGKGPNVSNISLNFVF